MEKQSGEQRVNCDILILEEESQIWFMSVTFMVYRYFFSVMTEVIAFIYKLTIVTSNENKASNDLTSNLEFDNQHPL